MSRGRPTPPIQPTPRETFSVQFVIRLSPSQHAFLKKEVQRLQRERPGSAISAADVVREIIAREQARQSQEGGKS